MNIISRINMRDEVLAYLAEEGFLREFSIHREGFLDLQAKRLYRPQQVHIHRVYRFSGDREDGAMDVLYTLITDTAVRGYVLPVLNSEAGAQLRAHLAHTGGMRYRRYQA